jgi:hypothetical protein
MDCESGDSVRHAGQGKPYGLQIHFAGALPREFHRGRSRGKPWIGRCAPVRSRFRHCTRYDGLIRDVTGDSRKGYSVALLSTASQFPSITREGNFLRPSKIKNAAWKKHRSYLNENWHPIVSDSFAVDHANRAMDGIYYNGGSWMRVEICSYVTGKPHRWSGAGKAMKTGCGRNSI